MSWINAKVELPPINTPVVIIEDGNVLLVECQDIYDNGRYIVWKGLGRHDTYCSETITHWMGIPNIQDWVDPTIEGPSVDEIILINENESIMLVECQDIYENGKCIIWKGVGLGVMHSHCSENITHWIPIPLIPQ